MKHIKLFEGFETNDYYQEISFADWVKMSIIDISPETISKLRDLGLDIIRSESAQIMTSKGLKRHQVAFISWKTIRYDGLEKQSVISILECEDEYFLLQFSVNGIVKNFRCDQWEGLVKCLIDEVIFPFYET
jgi:hypothetical protein